MKLDRDYQFQLLELMAETYPAPCNIISQMSTSMGAGRLAYIANVTYLESHGLINSGLQRSPTGDVIGPPSITHKGMDFLSDDGGLSAHLNVVNVRFAVDDLHDLLQARSSDHDKPTIQQWG